LIKGNRVVEKRLKKEIREMRDKPDFSPKIQVIG
jgi:hypothetical protein